MTTVKELMTEAAKATLRGDSDAVAKTEAALAALAARDSPPDSARLDSDHANLSKGVLHD